MLDERKRKLVEEESTTDVLKAMKEAKRLSSSMVAPQGIHSLDNPDLLAAIKGRKNEVATKELQAKPKGEKS